MSLPVNVDDYMKYMPLNEDELLDLHLSAIVKARVERLRGCYAFWLRYPRYTVREMVDQDKAMFGVSESQAYDDIHLCQLMLGNLNAASKEFWRWKVNQEIDEDRKAALAAGDFRALAHDVVNVSLITPLFKMHQGRWQDIGLTSLDGGSHHAETAAWHVLDGIEDAACFDHTLTSSSTPFTDQRLGHNLQNPRLNIIEEELLSLTCRTDGDIEDGLPLIIGLDANTNINCLVVGQVGSDQRLRIINSLYVKYERKLPEVAQDFCDYYKYLKSKRVIFYYDATFVGNSYATHTDDFYQIISRVLRRNGWLVTEVYIGKPWNHLQKQELINRMFKGKANHMILINQDNNEDLIISIESAGCYNNGKDKRGEKLVETDEDRLENRTDFSDAFDTVCIGAEKFPQSVLYTGSMSCHFST